MNRTAFKNGLIWMNIGEIAVVSGNTARSVSNSALLQAVTLRPRVHLSFFK